jgi:hypothetical protein
MIAVLLFSAFMTIRGKYLSGSSCPVFGLRRWKKTSDHPPFFAVVQSTAILLKSNPALKQTRNAFA